MENNAKPFQATPKRKAQPRRTISRLTLKAGTNATMPRPARMKSGIAPNAARIWAGARLRSPIERKAGVVTDAPVRGQEDQREFTPPNVLRAHCDACFEAGSSAIRHFGEYGTDIGTWIAAQREWRAILAVNLDANLKILTGNSRPTSNQKWAPHDALIGRFVDAAEKRRRFANHGWWPQDSF